MRGNPHADPRVVGPDCAVADSQSALIADDRIDRDDGGRTVRRMIACGARELAYGCDSRAD